MSSTCESPFGLDVGLTQQVAAELMFSDVFEQRGQDGQQSRGRVVDVLRDALHLAARVSELAQLQVLQGLLQILSCVLKERPQTGFDQLGSGLHHGPARETIRQHHRIRSANALTSKFRQNSKCNFCKEVKNMFKYSI